MCWKQFAMWILALACATGEIAVAEGPPNSIMFQQWVLGRTRFALIGDGCLRQRRWMFGTFRSRSRKTARCVNRSSSTATGFRFPEL